MRDILSGILEIRRNKSPEISYVTVAKVCANEHGYVAVAVRLGDSYVTVAGLVGADDTGRVRSHETMERAIADAEDWAGAL